MSAVWVTRFPDPMPTEPVILAERLLLRALEDTEAASEFETAYTEFLKSSESALKRGLDIKHQGPLALEQHFARQGTAKGIAKAFTAWCEQWLGTSNHVVGQTVVYALFRFLGIDHRRATRKQKESVFAGLGVTPDHDFMALSDPAQPRKERAIRKRAQARAKNLHMGYKQAAALTKWADYWWRARVTEPKSIALMAELEGKSESDFLEALAPWDSAVGYLRKPGRPRRWESRRERAMRLSKCAGFP